MEEGGDVGPRRVPRLAEVAGDALVDVVHVQALQTYWDMRSLVIESISDVFQNRTKTETV